MKAIVFDLDGTLVKQNGEGLRKRFRDMPVEGVKELSEIFSEREDYTTLVVTARTQDTREMTEEWLEENQISYENLYMRPKDEFDSDRDFKEKTLEKLEEEGYRVKYAVEDVGIISAMWRENDVTCLQVGNRSRLLKPFMRKLLKYMPSPVREIYFRGHESWFRNFRA